MPRRWGLGGLPGRRMQLNSSYTHVQKFWFKAARLLVKLGSMSWLCSHCPAPADAHIGQPLRHASGNRWVVLIGGHCLALSMLICESSLVATAFWQAGCVTSCLASVLRQSDCLS